MLPKVLFCDHKANKNRGGKAHACKTCRNSKRATKRRDSTHRLAEKSQMLARYEKYGSLPRPTHRVCTKCSVVFELSDDNFYRSKTSKIGYRPVCKSCVRQEHKRNYFSRTYRITPEEFYRGCEIVGNVCFICLQRKETLVVDHSHGTGKVRGLICWDCNLLLGMAKDDQETLDRARRYLDDPPGIPNVSIYQL